MENLQTIWNVLTTKNEFKKKTSITLIFYFILGLTIIFFQTYLLIIYTDIVPALILGIIILIVYFCFILYCLSKTNKLEIIVQNLEEEKLYNRTLSSLYDNIRGVKHDFNNIVQAIGGYISTNDIDGLKLYYNGLLEDCQKINNLSLLNPELINNPAIYSLLTFKYYKSDEIGIKMNLDIFNNLKDLNIKPYELTQILGILLDNAIDASSKCENKIINVTFRKDKKINRDLIIIENTYTNKNINLDKIFEKGFSTKITEDKKNHGLGLWEIRQILKKNDNLNLFTSKDTNFFKQQLEIYN